jgi:hypothetical protein
VAAWAGPGPVSSRSVVSVIMRLQDELAMSKARVSVDEIKAAIEALPEDECIRLWRWFAEMDWENWDKEIEEDSEAGRLDFLVREARNEKRRGELREL